MNNDRNFIAQQIRSQYVEKETTGLDELKKLDKKVKAPAKVFAYIFGSIGAVVMGSGMSLIMTDIGETIGMTETMIPGLVIGIAGMLIAIVNYPIFKGILSSRKKKYADEIIKLSNELIDNN